MTTVALPVEIKSRELYGKTWLGLCLVNNGYKVVIGESKEMVRWLDKIEPEIYITKDVGDTNIEFISTLVDAGILVCGLDPEDGVVGDNRQVNKIENKQTVLDYLSVYFSWGNTQTDALTSVDSTCRISTTGNPRFDLLSPSLRHIYSRQKKEFADKYGEYVLFNTNFVYGNHYDPEIGKEQRDKFHKDNQTDQIRYTTRLRHYFIQAILAVDSITEIQTVIVRPHPSEDVQTYKNEFEKYENIVVDQKGDVRSWILGSEAVVHNGCTTGIESALLNTPVISYEPIKDDEHRRPLPTLVSRSVSDVGSLCTALREYLQSDLHYEMTTSQTKNLKKYFHNIDTFASESIVDEINNLDTNDSISSDKLQLGLRNELIRNVMGLPYSDNIAAVYSQFTGYNKGYHEQKFPALSKDELRTICTLFNDALSYDVERIQVDRVERSENVFSLSLST